MNDYIESILKWISFSAIVLVIAGNIYVSSYYSEFNINIYEYIEISEVFSLFLSELLKLAAWVFPILMLVIAFYLNRDRLFSSSQNISRKWDIIQLILFLIILCGSVWSIFYVKSIIIKYIFSISGTIYFCITMAQVYIKYFSETKHVKWIYATIVIISVQSYFLIDKTGRTFAEELKSTNAINPQTVFYFENDTIKTSIDRKLIGSTNKYTFFYERVSPSISRTVIFNKDKLFNRAEILRKESGKD
jgi:hypothetical protein